MFEWASILIVFYEASRGSRLASDPTSNRLRRRICVLPRCACCHHFACGFVYKRAKLRRWTARSKFQNVHPHPPRCALSPGTIELGALGPSGTLTPFSSNLGVGFL